MKHHAQLTLHESVNAHKQENDQISRIPGTSTSRRFASDRALHQLSRHYPIRHAGLRRRSYLDSQQPGAHRAVRSASTNEGTYHVKQRHRLPAEVRAPRSMYRRPDGRIPLYERSHVPDQVNATHYTPWPAEQASWQHHRKIPPHNIRLYLYQCTQQKEKTGTRAFPQPH